MQISNNEMESDKMLDLEEIRKTIDIQEQKLQSIGDSL